MCYTTGTFFMQKLTKGILLILGFALALNIISHTFDGDLGWHLRFGRDAWQGKFPFTDTYTWGHAGELWVNHEWASDLIFWGLYRFLGYNSIVILTAVAVWAAFLLAPRLFLLRLSALSLSASLLALYSIKFILATRSTIIAPLLLVALWWSLEKIPEKKWHRAWPALLWLWSALHGSWILGFMAIGIYWIGNLGEYWLARRWPRYFRGTRWKKPDWIAVAGWALISLGATLLNPYGWRLWGEVTNYFTLSFYQHYIIEWIPSYAYPIFPLPLILAALAAVLLFRGWKKQLVDLPRLFLFAALFISAWQYKRNNIYLALAIAPIIAVASTRAVEIVKNLPRWKIPAPHFFRYLASLAAFACLVYLIIATHWSSNPWHDYSLLAANNFPLGAAEFLRPLAEPKAMYLFNEFRWGGFFNWTIPRALVYLDGRGTATWIYHDKESLYEHYRKIKFAPGGLAELEQSPANYILLEKNFSGYSAPDWFNRLIFSPNDFKQLFARQPVQLETDLNRSVRWQQIYADNQALIWERK